MPFKDIREFISKLEEEGEALRIEEEVDWDLEAGAMLRRAAEASLPATLFEKVRGYPEGYRLFGGGSANFSRLAIAMDMKPDTPIKKLMEEYLRRKRKPIKPVLVKYGSCKENIHIGQEVDLLEFPVPMIHGGDGGRYIGTWHLTISKDLDADWVNWGMYRHMLHTKNTIGLLQATPARDLWSMYIQSYEPRKKPMEVAIAIGVEPVSTLCAAAPLPYGVSEAGIAGGIRGIPVELIKCETVDLAVPATSEIVIEGEIRPNETMDEGPFGESTGYRTNAGEPRPVIYVKAVTHRNDPILTMSCPGVPVGDDCVSSLTKSSEILATLRAQGLPVAGVYTVPATSCLVTVVAVRVSYPDVADKIAHAIWETGAGYSTPYIIVVEDDVDPFNMAQVLHALATKCHPYRGIVRLERSPEISILPFLNRDEQKSGLGAKAYFDCTWPVYLDPSDVPRRISFREAYPLEVQQNALAKWRKYGY